MTDNYTSPSNAHQREPMRVNDVEKRWNDPAALRQALTYCLVVVVMAVAAGGLFAGTDQPIWAWAVPVVFLAGGIGALVQAYRIWRRGGRWPIWQGAGWLLFALMLATLALPVAG